MSSSLQCPACLARHTWTVCEMGGKWPYSCNFVECFCILVKFLSCCFFKRFVRVEVVPPFNNTDTDMVRKKSRFILSKSWKFHMLVNLPLAVNALSMSTLTLLSVDEILQPKYLNWSTNFIVELTSFLLKLCFIWIYVETNASCCLLQVCSRISAWACVIHVKQGNL